MDFSKRADSAGEAGACRPKTGPTTPIGRGSILQKLKSLVLDDTKITDAGLKEVAKLQQLKGLDLFDTKVTKVGVTELKKALPKCAISSNPKK